MNILVTGATSGIGESLVRNLAENHNVIACGRNQNKLDELRTTIGCNALSFDVTDKMAVMDASKHVAELDWLILNAGTCEYINDPVHFDSALFERVVRTNLIAIGYCLEAFSSKIKRGGKLVVISSSSVLLPLPRAEAYGASKAALTYLTRTLAITRPDIKVVVVHPGFVETPLTDKNDFPMPFVMSSAEAAERIVTGLKSGKSTIEFPKRLVWFMKLLALLPNNVWVRIARRMKN